MSGESTSEEGKLDLKQDCCNNCNHSIEAIGYKCSCCPNYLLCEDCITLLEDVSTPLQFASTAKRIHSENHPFVRYRFDAKKENRANIAIFNNRSSWRHNMNCNICSTEIVGFRFHCSQCAINICESKTSGY